jgi:hypothetical protein
MHYIVSYKRPKNGELVYDLKTRHRTQDEAIKNSPQEIHIGKYVYYRYGIEGPFLD